MAYLSIVIVTFNSLECIKACIDSIALQDYRDVEVIVVDNASKDTTAGFLKEHYPQVSLIENEKNLGASRARNQGIEIAQGKWILTLDSDVVLEKGFVKKVMDAAQDAEGRLGILQPKILDSGKKKIYSCGIYLSRLKRFYDIGKGEIDNGRLNAPRNIFGACSAAALYRREMLDDIQENTGYFDERFFFLVEDVDISWRAQKKNWKVLYCPEAVCYHAGNSSRTSQEMRQYLCWRNRRLFLKKHGGKRRDMLFSAVCYDFPRLCFLLLANASVRAEVLSKNNHSS